MKKYICVFTLFILVNLLILGCMQVYKVSYNTMNSEHIQMVSISGNIHHTNIEILDRNFDFDIIPKNFSTEKLIYMLYGVSGDNVRSAAEIIGYADKYFFNEQTDYGR